MTGDKATEPNPPRTLFEVHEALARIRPRQTAPPAEWLAYYQKSAALFAEVAEIDRGHHHELLYLAEHDRERAKQVKAEIASGHLVIGHDGGDERGENRDSGPAANADAST
jgi:hypothetical protein